MADVTNSETSRNAVVTGAASGIGAATVRALATAGWRVAALDRNGPGAEAVAREAAHGAIAVEVDLGSEPSVVAAFETVKREFGVLHGLAACAGIVDSTPFLELDADTFERILRVNLIGTFLSMREAAKLMAAAGRICTVASVAGLRGGGLFGTAAYAASKSGVIGLTKTAARGLASRQITCNCVVPGPIRTAMLEGFWQNAPDRERVTGMIPLGRPGESTEVADAIRWLLSGESSFVNGATIAVDGGLTMH